MTRGKIVLAGLLIFLSLQYCAAVEPLTVDQLVEKHLASIGKPEARAAVKSRVAQGKSKWEVVTGGAGSIEGNVTVVSEARKVREILRLGSSNYRGEDWLTDGDKVQVAKTWISTSSPNEPKRSLIGDFLYNETALLREGLLSGALGTGWPLLDPKYFSAKLSYDGLKTVEGRQLHEVKYLPKKRSDADIRLYFDQDFRHVMTIANMTIEPRLLSGGSGSMGGDFMDRGTATDGGMTANARQQPIRYRMVETFDKFQQVDGLTLPTVCNIKFSAEGYSSSQVNYTTTFAGIEHNVPMDARNFQSGSAR